MHSLILNEVLPKECYYQIVKDSRVGHRTPVIESMSQWLNSYQHKDVTVNLSCILTIELKSFDNMIYSNSESTHSIDYVTISNVIEHLI